MTETENKNNSPANILCMSCGLCCTGHLFLWTKLRSAELDSIQKLGADVIREPEHRGFNQPCPLWDGVCTIHGLPQYPRYCHTYKCKLLKKLLDGIIALPSALNIIQHAKSTVHELELLLPDSSKHNFRERLTAYMEHGDPDSKFRKKAEALLETIEDQFGINDFFS